MVEYICSIDKMEMQSGLTRNKRQNNMQLEEIKKALEKRGFMAEVFATGKEAADFAMSRVAAAENVGWGGSETVKQIGLRDMVVASGKEIRDHRMDCDLFLLSANALTADGRIVNIDGNGNRVAASIFGPKEVVFIVGRNKIVDGGIDAAIERIKRCACPPNCRRLNKHTPCAATGKCADCDSPDRICKVTVIHERPPTHTPTRVLLVDEDLGY